MFTRGGWLTGVTVRIWGFRAAGWVWLQQFLLLIVNFHCCKRVLLSIARKPGWLVTSDPEYKRVKGTHQEVVQERQKGISILRSFPSECSLWIVHREPATWAEVS